MYPERSGALTAISPNGELAATALRAVGSDGFELWDPATGKVIAALGEQRRLVTDLAFSPDGSVLASVYDGAMSGSISTDGEVRFWDVETREEALRLKPPQGSVSIIEFSPDGEVLATANAFGLVQLWDVTSGELETSFRGNSSGVRDLEFSHDGGTLVAITDLGLSSWQVESGTHTRLAQEFIPDLPYYAVFGFSPDDRYIGLNSADGLRIWDLDRDTAAADIPVGNITFDALFVLDEWHVIVAADTAVRVVDVGFLADPYMAVCEQAGRELTSEEWETYLPDIEPDDLEVC